MSSSGERRLSAGAFSEIIAAYARSRPEMTTSRAGLWIRVSFTDRPGPRQGWKLHLSADVESAAGVLAAALGALEGTAAPFKVCAEPSLLAALNEGDGGFSQVGKFITVYPASDEAAVGLAERLDAATCGYHGPRVPSDKQLRPGSLVHYRYGAFDGAVLQLATGEVVPALQDPSGQLVPDRRRTYFDPPPWASNPFSNWEAPCAAEVAEQAAVSKRYRTVSVLSHSPRSTVRLAVDLHALRRVVVKSAPAVAAGDEAAGGQRLRYEADVLSRLSPHPALPRVYDLFELGGTLHLVLEDIPGRTLEQEVQREMLLGRQLSAARVLDWAGQLTEVLGHLHEAGLVYRDLKSTNVIVDEDGRVRLIDLELATPVGEAPRHGNGTIGYMSPQQVRRGPACVTDDVYALGALIALMAAGVEPSLAPDHQDLLGRPLELLNPGIAPTVARIAARCLDRDPVARPQTMAEVRALLAGAAAEPCAAAPPLGEEIARLPEAQARDEAAALAARLGDSLCREAVPSPDGVGVSWVSSHLVGLGLPARYVNVGTAGVILALAEIYSRTEDERHRNVLVEGCRGLAASQPFPGAPVAGLYAGEAGVGAALLRAGQVTSEERWIEEAELCSDRLASYPCISPDLFNGTAGRLRFELMLWHETARELHLERAIACGEALLAQVKVSELGHARWPIPEGLEGLTGEGYPGYAHGAAGIADALLDLADVTEDPRLLVAARDAGRWLESLAVAAGTDGDALEWPGGGGHGGGLWCHGSAGIGIFLLRAGQRDLWPRAHELALRAAAMVARGSRWSGPVQCHGLAGAIELLLDVYQETGDARWLREARSLQSLLLAFRIERDGQLTWGSDRPRLSCVDYMVGYAGVACCLLRLADPEGAPRQLSVKGFSRARVAQPAG